MDLLEVVWNWWEKKIQTKFSSRKCLNIHMLNTYKLYFLSHGKVYQYQMVNYMEMLSNILFWKLAKRLTVAINNVCCTIHFIEFPLDAWQALNNKLRAIICNRFKCALQCKHFPSVFNTSFLYTVFWSILSFSLSCLLVYNRKEISFSLTSFTPLFSLNFLLELLLLHILLVWCWGFALLKTSKHLIKLMTFEMFHKCKLQAKV